MKKNLLKIMSVVMVCITLCTFALPVCASENISDDPIQNNNDLVQPCYYNCASTSTSFSVNGGNAYVAVVYDAYSDTFTYARLNVKIQKQFLGLFWTDVDLGTSSGEWVGYNYDVQTLSSEVDL